eukprot:scaffold34685_cov183-Amphora_coffeaeformis.AAC.2
MENDCQVLDASFNENNLPECASQNQARSTSSEPRRIFLLPNFQSTSRKGAHNLLAITSSVGSFCVSGRQRDRYHPHGIEEQCMEW